MASTASTSSQLQAVLSTKQERYAVPDVPLAIPADVSIKDLSSIVNRLLQESRDEHQEIEFDFLVGGEFLRVPLSEHLQERDLSSEDVVSIEYLERLPAPEPEDCLHHDDWVSAVRCQGDWILSGSYDNSLHLWTTRGKHRLAIPGHMEPVTAVTWVKHEGDIASFISTSQDQTAMVWRWNLEQNSVECVQVCRGHQRSVQCVGVDPTSTHMATGSWDNMLKIWGLDDSPENLDSNESSGITPSKKRRLDANTRVPILTLQGHKECVSGLVWIDSSQICTCSWDHTLRVWDVSTQSKSGGSKLELPGNKAFMDLCWTRHNPHCVLTASADSLVRMYDVRSVDGSVVKASFKSHKGWVSQVCWAEDDPNLFVSAAFDMLMKMWDIRSPKAPLYDMTGHRDKIMCCDWSNPELMMSGGADNMIRIYSRKTGQQI